MGQHVKRESGVALSQNPVSVKNLHCALLLILCLSLWASLSVSLFVSLVCLPLIQNITFTLQ